LFVFRPRIWPDYFFLGFEALSERIANVQGVERTMPLLFA